MILPVQALDHDLITGLFLMPLAVVRAELNPQTR